MTDALRRGIVAPEAVEILLREHANIFRVLGCLEELISDVAVPLETDRLRAILDFMEGFSDTLHHPKEEHYLIPALVRRKPDLALLVQKIQEEHDESAAMTTDLRRNFEACLRDPDATAHFRALAKDYCEFQYRHMMREDRGLLPVALEVLTDEDMDGLNQAFTRADDPMIGAEHQNEFQRLYDAIVSDPEPGPDKDPSP
jgi:branched-chain amino acid transport system ATP-binding protein